MLISDYDYDLPPELIAQYPLAERGASQLLTWDAVSGSAVRRTCAELDQLLKPGDLVIGNDTRVVAARLIAAKPTGGRVEIMLERLVDAQTILVQLRSSKSLKPGQTLEVGGRTLTVEGREDRFYLLSLPPGLDPVALFQSNGAIPLPPYINRAPEADDLNRYQTVYAAENGAVAAPTAGLHIDNALIERLRARDIGWDTITLHVGAGTFLPVSSDDLDDHVMHAERISVSAALCERIANVRSRGGAVVAIGTTVVRALESAAMDGQLRPFEGETRLFIKPGFQFQIVDQLMTNFHLPKSTLLVLVSAFAGASKIRDLYQYAIAERMRFFSYGDAMLLERSDAV